MAEITVTLKADKGYEAPWIVVRADDAKDMQKALTDIHEQDVFTSVGRASAAFATGNRMGSQLGATTIAVESTEPEEKPAKKPAAKKAAPKKAETPAKAEEAPKEEPKKARPKPAWAN